MHKTIGCFYVLMNFVLQAAAQLQPVNLTCEYLKDPIGIDISKPRFSWKFTTTGRNQFQSAYEIIVSDNFKTIQEGGGSTCGTNF